MDEGTQQAIDQLKADIAAVNRRTSPNLGAWVAHTRALSRDAMLLPSFEGPPDTALALRSLDGLRNRLQAAGDVFSGIDSALDRGTVDDLLTFITDADTRRAQLERDIEHLTEIANSRLVAGEELLRTTAAAEHTAHVATVTADYAQLELQRARLVIKGLEKLLQAYHGEDGAAKHTRRLERAAFRKVPTPEPYAP